MGMKTYKNKTKNELVISGVGVVAPEGELKTDKEVNNPNLELVEKETNKDNKKEK